MTKFQAGLYIFLGIVIFAGVALFAGFVPGTGPSSGSVELSLWGTESADTLNELFDSFNDTYKSTVTISYTEVDSRSFDRDLVEALARGAGPDLILFSPDLIARQGDKLLPIPNSVFSQRDYLNTFIDGGEIFMTQEGTLGMPVAVDPMVMYWNKDLFADAGVARVPAFWDEVLALAPALTTRDTKGNITKSMIALGGFRNIMHAKDILSTLFLQVGDDIAEPVFTKNGVSPEITLGRTRDNAPSQAESALRFFVEFGNPSKKAYSWNSALPNSRDLFNTGSLAMYLAPASELALLREGNPHIAIDVARIPQLRPVAGEVSSSRVYGRLLAVGALASSPNREKAVEAALLISSENVGPALAASVGIASARRDALAAENASDAVAPIVNRAALSVRSWLDPSPFDTEDIFRSMVEGALTGNASEFSLVSRARDEMSALIR